MENELLIKYDQNPYSKKIYVEKAKDYCVRAKDIRDKMAPSTEITFI